MSISYLNGDATCPQAKGAKVIAHICNDIGGWGKGFVLALSKRWSKPEACYREWYNHKGREAVCPQDATKGRVVLTTDFFGLGQVQLVQVLPDTYVANMIAQHGTKTGSKGPPIRYDALAECLRRLECVTEALPDTSGTPMRASLHMPRIGCGLAGGRWDRVEPLITGALRGRDVYVYDFG